MAFILKVKSDHRSKFSNLINWKEEAWKVSGLQRDSNPWPPRYWKIYCDDHSSLFIYNRSTIWIYISRRLFYCYSTRGCRVIQDLDLCKLDDLWRHIVDTDVKSQTMEYLWTLFLYRPETLCSCYTRHKVLWYVQYDLSISTQWAPGPLHSKGEIRVFLLQERLAALVVLLVCVSEHQPKKVR